MSSRRSARIGRAPKRSLLASTTTTTTPPTRCSPYFWGFTKRPRHPVDKLRAPGNDLNRGNPLAAPSAWIPTNELPSHLIGNDYFDDNNNSNRKNGSTTLLLRTDTPEGFSLSQAICSYGYICLAPNRWVPGKPTDGTAAGGEDDEGYLVRPLTHRRTAASSKGPPAWKTARVAIGQDPTTGSVLVAIDDSSALLDQGDQRQQLTAQIDRMLRLDNTSLEVFHELCPDAKERGFGRLYRSPTLLEYVIKTITNCNMKWGGTVEMNAKLCQHVGRDGAFLTPEEIHAVGPDFLKERCRVGYRGKYIWAIARNICEGTLDLASALGSNPNGRCHHARCDVQKRLLELSGIGPFTANNILQLMGYFDTHPYDTETVRLWKEEFGASKSATKAEVFEAP